MRLKTLRSYVWIFCLYVFTTAQGIFYRHIDSKPDSGPLFVSISSLVLQAFVTCWLFSLFAEFSNMTDRWIITLTAAGCASKLASNLHRLDYISFGTPYWLTVFFIFVATIVFAFRIDALLRKHNAEIEESASISETAEGH